MKYISELIIIFYLVYVQCDIDRTVVRARVESCPSCSLNRLPEVKQFIYDDLPKYKNVDFKKIHGAPPELVLLNEADQIVNRLELKRLNRKECNELLQSNGFNISDKNEL